MANIYIYVPEGSVDILAVCPWNYFKWKIKIKMSVLKVCLEIQWSFYHICIFYSILIWSYVTLLVVLVVVVVVVVVVSEDYIVNCIFN
jgi:hypothetical protein